MAYSLITLFGCLATYGQAYLDAEVIVAANRTMLDGKYNHVKYDVAEFSCINFCWAQNQLHLLALLLVPLLLV